MSGARDVIFWLACIIVAGLVAHGARNAFEWVDRPFAGFLLLENQVVPSAGLTSWPAVEGGEIFQQELIEIDGQPIRNALELQEHARTLPVGTEVRYRYRDSVIERVVETRMFTWLDGVLLFGSFLFCGLGLTGMALTIRFLRPEQGSARGSALSMGLIGFWALTATDLYGPYLLFRVHAALECMLFAGTLHLALVFPQPRRLAIRIPGLLPGIYAFAALLAAWNQWGLYDAATYALTHRLAMSAFGLSAICLIGALLHTYLRPPSFAARQRVKVLALGSVAALTPQVVLSLISATSGGQAPENLMGWSGIFFPLAVGYAVLRRDLLEVDTIVRRAVNYGLLTALVAVGYGLLAGLLDGAFRESAGVSPWVSGAAIGAISAGVLLPLRDQMQSIVDRLFFRNSFDARRLLERTSDRLVAVTDIDRITAEIESAAQEGLHPIWTRVALVPRENQQSAGGSSPSTGVFDRKDGAIGVPCVVENRTLAVLLLGPSKWGRSYGGDDRRFLQTLANQGAIAIQNAAAVYELRDLNRTLEHKVEERTEELGSALDELRETQNQMVHQEKMASVGQLVAGVAHELNNPLNFIEGNLFHLREYVDVLTSALQSYEGLASEASASLRERLASQRETLDVDYVLEDLGALFEACDEGVKRLTTIVRDLRTFSRLDGGQLSEIDLAESLDATLNLLRGRLTGIDVRRSYEPTPPVIGMEGQLGQVFMNLLANAADALGEQGTIEIGLHPLGEDRVEVTVRDDGCGIPEDERSRIFEPFFTTKEVGKGTGLGLAISYGIVSRHQGRIEVESAPGRGTCFRIELPIEGTLPEPDEPQVGADEGR